MAHTKKSQDRKSSEPQLAVDSTQADNPVRPNKLLLLISGIALLIWFSILAAAAWLSL